MVCTRLDFMLVVSVRRQALQALKLIAILVNAFNVLLGCVFLLIGRSKILLSVMQGVVGNAGPASVV